MAKQSEERKNLKKLLDAVALTLDDIDKEMEQPSNYERGKRIAAITNRLEMAYDSARRFGLGESLKSDRRRK